jgi:glucans biosynthesis protein
VPATLPAPGQPLDIAWRVDWQGDAQQRPKNKEELAWVAQTRVGHSFATLAKDEQQYIVDFTGPALPSTGELKAVASANSNGRITESNVYRINAVGATGSWRMALRVQTLNPAQPVELRAFLTAPSSTGPQTVSETWTYIQVAP